MSLVYLSFCLAKLSIQNVKIFIFICLSYEGHIDPTGFRMLGYETILLLVNKMLKYSLYILFKNLMQ